MQKRTKMTTEPQGNHLIRALIQLDPTHLSLILVRLVNIPPVPLKGLERLPLASAATQAFKDICRLPLDNQVNYLQGLPLSIRISINSPVIKPLKGLLLSLIRITTRSITYVLLKALCHLLMSNMVIRFKGLPVSIRTTIGHKALLRPLAPRALAVRRIIIPKARGTRVTPTYPASLNLGKIILPVQAHLVERTTTKTSESDWQILVLLDVNSMGASDPFSGR